MVAGEFASTEVRPLESPPVSDAALKKLLGIARRSPQDPVAWLRFGHAALEVGRREEAHSALIHAMALPAATASVLLAIGDLLRSGGWSEEAVHAFRRAAEHGPEGVARLGSLLLESDQTTAAVEVLRAGSRTWPEAPSLRLLLIDALERAGLVAEASQVATVLASVSPDHLAVHCAVGRVMGRLGDTDASARAWARAAALAEPGANAVHTAHGIALSKNGQHAEAIEILSAVARTRASDPEAQANLGFALLEAGRVGDAAAVLALAVSLDESAVQAHSGLGSAYHAMGRLAEAITEFQAVIRLSPDWALGWYNLGLLHYEVGEIENARRALLRAAALAPDDNDTRELLEEVLTRPAETSAERDSAIHGQLHTFPLPDLLEFLRVGAKTGTLMVVSDSGAGVIRLLNGTLTNASSPRGLRLGELLVEKKLITRETFRRALLLQRDGMDAAREPEMLGQILLRAGLVEPEQLRRAVFQQILTAFEELLQWSQGTFAFHSADPATFPANTLVFDLQHVMMETMRRLDERRRDEPTPV
jgi:tetratricopeptide (TPR) repeat protein